MLGKGEHTVALVPRLRARVNTGIRDPLLATTDTRSSPLPLAPTAVVWKEATGGSDATISTSMAMLGYVCHKIGKTVGRVRKMVCAMSTIVVQEYLELFNLHNQEEVFKRMGDHEGIICCTREHQERIVSILPKQERAEINECVHCPLGCPSFLQSGRIRSLQCLGRTR